MDNNIPIIVFSIEKPENIVKIIKGEKIGTLIKREE
jgi:uridylate kinase